MEVMMYRCEHCDRLYVEPDADRENFGMTVCPYCGHPHEFSENFYAEDMSDLIEGLTVDSIRALRKEWK